MIFSSYRFLFLFLPAALAGYHGLRLWRGMRLAKVWLVAASLVFYGVGQPSFLLGFCALAAGNYLLAWALSRCTCYRRLLMAAAAVWNLGALFLFKYLNFFLEGVGLLTGRDFPAIELLLPIGISFFTFQMLAYAADIYRDPDHLDSPLDYAVFITFFPQLIVGPVVKRPELMPQLQGDGLKVFDRQNICRGLMLLSIGCAKKTVLADPLIAFAKDFYGGDVFAASWPAAWCGVLAFTFAYYFDFSGYIDMARGIGHLFGVDLPINFDSPYKARNFADFWRRWNMTISRFFSESVFNKLFHFGDRTGKLILATLATFLVSGLWHGADWHYLAWGLVNGVGVCAANLMTLHRKSLPTALAVPMTFVASALVRVLFDCSGLTQALGVYKALVTPAAGSLAAFVVANWYVLALLLIGAVICFCCKNSNGVSQKTAFTAKDALVCGALMALSLVHMSQVSGFLYFNF